MEAQQNNNTRDSRIKFIFLCVIGYLLLLSATWSGTGDDTYWHIKVGEWIVTHKKVPSTGIFSYTAADLPWVSHEWLSALIIYIIYSLVGWPGLVLLETMSIGLAMLLMSRFLLKRTSANACLIYLLLAFLLLIPHMMPRPHILALPITVFWTVQLIEACEDQKAPHLLLGLFMTLWVNTHGSFIIGLAFILFFGAESVSLANGFSLRAKLAKQWLLFFIASSFACILSPHGIDGLLLPFKLTGQKYTLDSTLEWASPDFHYFQPLELWLMLLLVFSLGKGLTLPMFRMIFVLGLLHLSLKYSRFSSDLLAFLAPLALAGPFAKQLKKPANISIEALYPKKLKHWLMLTLYLGAMMLILQHRTTIEAPRSQQVLKVLSALQSEKAVLGNVLNGYDIGTYLIYRNYPVFIDSRAEPYGDEFIRDFAETVALSKGVKALRNKISQNQITWTIFPTNQAVNVALELMPELRKLYADKYVTIFLAADRDISKQTKLKLEQIKNSMPKDDPKNAENERLF